MTSKDNTKTLEAEAETGSTVTEGQSTRAESTTRLPGSINNDDGIELSGSRPSPPIDQTDPAAAVVEEQQNAGSKPLRRDAKFLIVFIGLVGAGILSALDGALVSTALPTIVAELNIGPDYVWVANSYFLTSAVVQPLFGQLSDIWGRRWVFLLVVGIFTLGSGLCGGANSGTMLIAARGVQGIGGGGINMIIDLILCDLLPMRERAKYMGILFSFVTVFTSCGPLIGGALAQAGAWRWAFYMNVPIGVLIMVAMWFFLKVEGGHTGPFRQGIKRIDVWGISILSISTVATLYALTYGGSLRTWADSAVVGPLVAGLLLLAVFVLFEGTAFPKEPVTPYRLFGNRTSVAAFYLSFQHALLCYWITYMYPLYFQAVVGATPTMSGIYFLPFVFSFPVAAAVGGPLVAKYGRYKPVHLIGFTLVTVGYGASAALTRDSSPALWVFLQLFTGAGLGMIITCLLPAVQAKLTEADTALSTGTWAFIRSIGTIWGVSIPAAVFNNRVDQLLPTIDDPAARLALSGGQAYAHASDAFIDSFPPEIRDQVLNVYTLSLQRVWIISLAFAGSALVAVFLEREVTLRTELDTKYGLTDEKKKEDVSDPAGVQVPSATP